MPITPQNIKKYRVESREKKEEERGRETKGSKAFKALASALGQVFSSTFLQKSSLSICLLRWD